MLINIKFPELLREKTVYIVPIRKDAGFPPSACIIFLFLTLTTSGGQSLFQALLS